MKPSTPTLAGRLAAAFAIAAAPAATCALADEDASQRAGSDWWSLQPVERPALPKINNGSWPRNPIDHFILARLEAEGLEPAPEADAHTLSRRLHFGLVGLPPEPGSRADVDALLASPHYGERWARHWLDVARFGESDGFEYDALRPNAWPYRDWVIEALNSDMPFDRFAKLQIAGDVLEPGNPDAITATGFLVCGAFDGLKPSGEKQRKIMRQDEMEDLVGTLAQTFLGLTVHCARCHDHKFDPVSQKEYYQMASALAGVHRGEREVPAGGDPVALQKQIGAISAKLRATDEAMRAEILALKEDGRAAAGEAPPSPIARWSFDQDLRDEIGGAHGKAEGGAKIIDGALHLDGENDYVATAPHPAEQEAKT